MESIRHQLVAGRRRRKARSDLYLLRFRLISYAWRVNAVHAAGRTRKIGPSVIRHLCVAGRAAYRRGINILTQVLNNSTGSEIIHRMSKIHAGLGASGRPQRLPAISAHPRPSRDFGLKTTEPGIACGVDNNGNGIGGELPLCNGCIRSYAQRWMRLPACAYF